VLSKDFFKYSRVTGFFFCFHSKSLKGSLPCNNKKIIRFTSKFNLVEKLVDE
jgi:hypothetical protein